VQTRVVLRMADLNEYHGMNLPADVLKPASPPGRGLLGGASAASAAELQVAILGARPDVGSQAANLREFARALTVAGVRPAPPVAEVPRDMPLDRLPAAVDGLPVLGVAATTLLPQPFAADGVFLVVGAPQSGRTTALRTLAAALLRWDPAIQLYCLSAQRRSRLAQASCWAGRATGADLPGRRAAVVLENVVELAGMAEAPLTDLLKVCRDEGVFVVAEAESSALTSSYGVLGQVRAGRYGLALAPDMNDGDRFRTPFPARLNRADFPPGRALLVRGGTTTVVQVGHTADETR
jgi:S-DNA-T family DNA segregation ATPase FtsK/SpoIIIE